MVTESLRAYSIDPTHSDVQFSVRHLMISKVRGHFKTVAGLIVLPLESIIPTSVNVTIDASTIETRDPQRDAHLKSADFLDVEKFPSLRFASEAVRAIDAQDFEVDGTLEIRGSQRPVTLKASIDGSGKDPWGNDRVAYEATVKISRKDWGLTYNQVLEAGGVAIGDEIDILINVEAIPRTAGA